MAQLTTTICVPGDHLVMKGYPTNLLPVEGRKKKSVHICAFCSLHYLLPSAHYYGNDFKAPLGVVE